MHNTQFYALHPAAIGQLVLNMAMKNNTLDLELLDIVSPLLMRLLPLSDCSIHKELRLEQVPPTDLREKVLEPMFLCAMFKDLSKIYQGPTGATIPSLPISKRAHVCASIASILYAGYAALIVVRPITRALGIDIPTSRGPLPSPLKTSEPDLNHLLNLCAPAHTADFILVAPSVLLQALATLSDATQHDALAAFIDDRFLIKHYDRTRDVRNWRSCGSPLGAFLDICMDAQTLAIMVPFDSSIRRGVSYSLEAPMSCVTVDLLALAWDYFTSGRLQGTRPEDLTAY